LYVVAFVKHSDTKYVIKICGSYVTYIYLYTHVLYVIKIQPLGSFTNRFV